MTERMETSNNDGNKYASLMQLLTRLLLFAQCFAVGQAYECIRSCGYPKTTLYTTPDNPECLLRLPDNPGQFEPMPCQLEVLTNCSRACHLELEFVQFTKQPCDSGVLVYTDQCHHLQECEYLVVEEMSSKGEVTSNHMLQGNMTSQRFAVKSSHVRINVCYSADSFTSRSAHILIRAVETFPEGKLNLGPTSVWVLCTLVLVFTLAILVIAKCKWLDKWLSPPPPPPLLPVPVPKA